MILALLLVSSGFFALSVGWYGWRVEGVHSGLRPLPSLLFGMTGVVLMTLGAWVVMR